MLTPVEVQQALDIARALAAAGVPIRVAHPARDELRRWEPDGGHGDTGYWLPKKWQASKPDPEYVGAWRSDDALIAVMGHGLDLLDVDPRNGGDVSRAELIAAGNWPDVLAVASTPSGGTHEFVASLGVNSLDNFRPGIDVKAGLDTGKGRGFAFIAPTVRLSKITKAPAPYRWITPPNVAVPR